MTRNGIARACEAADAFRKRAQAGMLPAAQLFDICERAGILVLRVALQEALSGAFVRSRRRNGPGVILVNVNRKSVQHQRFTLAHEIGHITLHEDCDGLVESVQEGDQATAAIDREANAFAAALLVPLAEIKRRVDVLAVGPKDVGDRLVIELGRAFGVSHHVVLRRLRILGNLPFGWVRQREAGANWGDLWNRYAPECSQDRIVQDTVIVWSAQGVSRETASQLSRFPAIYREMAFEAYKTGRITAARLAELLELPDSGVVMSELRPLLRPDLVVKEEQAASLLRQSSKE